jgi:adhesin transport system membrane fusion protein
LLASLLVWSFFAELDEVAVAQGEVVPKGQVKTIQHLEGGIIKGIFVREGDHVKTGNPLVQLDLLSTSASREELAVRLDGYLLVAARLKGQSRAVDPLYDPDVAARRKRLQDLEKERYAAYIEGVNSTLAVYKERFHQRELEVRLIKSKKKTIRNDLDLAREEFAMSTKLLKDGLTSKLDHLKLKREVEMLAGNLAELKVSLPRAKSAVAEAREEMNNQAVQFRRLSGEEQGKVELEIARLEEELAKATDQVRRLEIRSPIDGVVKSLRYNTIDGVVRPGDSIMDIVPVDEDLVIEARLNPVDVGYVRAGQPTVVKISTYDYVRYGGLDGEVVDISPDSHTDSDGNTYFRIVVRTEKNFFGENAGELPISPGMQATVDVHTGRKSVLRYLLNPILKLKYESFRER